MTAAPTTDQRASDAGECGSPAAAQRANHERGQAWARDVLAALDALELRTSAAVRLVYLHHATQAQVAARLGRPEAEIRTLVAHGLRQMATLVVPAGSARIPPTGAGSDARTGTAP